LNFTIRLVVKIAVLEVVFSLCHNKTF